MAGPQQQYLREMHRRFGYFATWLPTTPLQVGDVGTFDGNVFTKVRHITDFNLPNPATETGDPSDFSYSAADQTTVTVKAAGTAAPAGSLLDPAKAGVVIEFGRKGAVLFEALGSAITAVKDRHKLSEGILNLYKQSVNGQRRWDSSLCVVTDVVKCKSATLFISDSRDSKIELNIGAQAALDGAFSLASASLQLSVAVARDVSTRVIAASGLTPLFKAWRIVDPWFGPPAFQPMHPAMASEMSEQSMTPSFEPVAFRHGLEAGVWPSSGAPSVLGSLATLQSPPRRASTRSSRAGRNR